MLRCIKAHSVASFGEIPVGSLWDDDSPYVTDEACFVDADYAVFDAADIDLVEVGPKPAVKRPAKKSVAATVKES